MQVEASAAVVVALHAQGQGTAERRRQVTLKFERDGHGRYRPEITLNTKENE